MGLLSKKVAGRQANRREREIHNLRKEVKCLNKEYRVSSAEEKDGIMQMHVILSLHVRRIRRMERTRKLRRESEKCRAQFRSLQLHQLTAGRS